MPRCRFIFSIFAVSVSPANQSESAEMTKISQTPYTYTTCHLEQVHTAYSFYLSFRRKRPPCKYGQLAMTNLERKPKKNVAVGFLALTRWLQWTTVHK